MTASKNLSALLKKIEIARWDYITSSRSRTLIAADLVQLSLRKYELCNFRTAVGDVFGHDLMKGKYGDDFKSAESRLMYRHLKHNAPSRTSVVRELMRSAETIKAWEFAREENDFSIAAPHLERSIEAERDAAKYSRDHLLWEDYKAQPELPIDVAMDKKSEDFRPRHIIAWGEDLIPFCQGMLAKQKMFQATQRYLHDDAFHMPADKQEKLLRGLLTKLGYDDTRGKIAPSPHPICLGRNDDVRIGYTIDENNFLNTLLSTAHEAGHAFYRQNLPQEHKDELCGDVAGNIVDEAMALLFENHVMRTKAGAQLIYDMVSREVGEPYKSRLNPQMIYKHMDKLEPHGTRAKADDVRYPLDIMHRFGMVKDLYSGEVRADDLKSAWNKRYEDMTGIAPKDDRYGILQDVHLFGGEAAWLTTYLPGRLAAAQLAEACVADCPDVGKAIALYGGFDRDLSNLEPFKEWLRENICQEGARLRPFDLLQSATGQALSTQAYMAHVKDRYAPPRMPVVATQMGCAL